MSGDEGATRHGGSGRRGAHGARAGLTDKRCRLFLDRLAATCNVQASAAAVGSTPAACYRRRRVDAAFAAEWEGAVEMAYHRLEEALVLHALREVADVGVDGDRGAGGPGGGEGRGGDTGIGPAIGVDPAPGGGSLAGKVARGDVQFALALLNRRGTTRAKERERPGRRRPSAEEIETTLNAKLDALARRLVAPESDA